MMTNMATMTVRNHMSAAPVAQVDPGLDQYGENDDDEYDEDQNPHAIAIPSMSGARAPNEMAKSQSLKITPCDP